jgi:hypothetical protein|tara:strand:+ start:2103 stop:2378 length:276 start_codon:yes stop_codon:yes gene_type:complete
MLINLIGFFGGFMLSSILDTTLGELQEWAIVGAALVVACLEILNKMFYLIASKIVSFLKEKYYIIRLLNLINYLKVGLIYGLIVDAFKLGS